jgi:preprotein translocase subunit SecY
MDFRKILQTIVSYIPTVKRPRQNVSFKRKALWTISILLMYFIMTNIPILGLGQGGSDAFGQFRGILAGGQGSLLQLGIMPIVTASIVLQILTGTNIMNLDMNDPRDQDLYQGLRRLLIVAMVLINAIPVVYSGSYLPPSQGLVAQFGEFPILTLMLVQVAGGGLLLFYMDEIVSKWGIGSGLGLFIIAGISQRMIGGIFTQLIPGWWDIIVGSIQVQFSLSGAQIVLLGPGQLIPIITTVLIFIIVIGAESTKVQIPTNRKRSGVKGTYDVKLVYASVMPVILVRAIQANIQFIGSALDGLFGPALPAFVGQFQDGQAYSGIFYYFTPILRPQDWMWWAGSTTAEPWMIILRIIVDFSFMTIGGALFAVFWVRTTNKDAEAIAKQLDVQDMEIPGFRSSSSRMEKVLDRYIPYVTIIGGALIGALSVVANILGTIGMVGGTGLLLTVSITYKIYEEIKREMVESKYGDKFGLIG